MATLKWMKSGGFDMGDSVLSLVPLLQPFSIQTGFWQAQSSRRRNGCFAIVSAAEHKVKGGKIARNIFMCIRSGFNRPDVELQENRWCVKTGGLIMLHEFQPLSETSPGLFVALQSISGRCMSKGYKFPACGFVFQRWQYCPSQDPWLLQCQVLCTWTGGELCGLPRWPHCQRLPGPNSEGEQGMFQQLRVLL